MTNLNFKHLRYFWVVGTEGSIAKASDILHLTPQTISGQLKELERQAGVKLFKKSGRKLILSEMGQLVFNYANEMFRIGSELEDVLEGRDPNAFLSLRVGVAMVVPKLLAYRVLEPVLKLTESVNLICNEAPLEDLLANLSIHKLDMVLSDCPVTPTLNTTAYNHVLGESGISFFATTSLAQKYTENFPYSLNDAPILMPTPGCALRRMLELWFENKNIHPVVVAEFADRALMKAFGEASAGIFTTPTAVEADVLRKYAVTVVGRTTEVKESFYAISVERKIKHPAIAAITENARFDLFSSKTIE